MKKLLLALSLTLFAACGSHKDRIEINGQFFGQPAKTIFLEELSPNGSVIVDSTVTDDKGNFNIIIEKPNEVPTFYNIHLGDSYVPVLAEKGEKIDLSAVGNIFFNYTVEGSKGSALIKEFNSLLRNTTLELDSILNLYENAIDPQITQQLGEEYFKKYIDLKRNAIKFIVVNSNSLAALLPLYHPKSDGQFLFDQPEDYIYFKMVSDSLSAKYPQSPYTRSLKSDLQKVMDLQTVDSMMLQSLQQTSDFPDVVMTDAEGKKQRLSDYKGKTILLDFTASTPAELKVINRELINVYNKYKNRDFVVFQVSLDANKAAWLKSVSDARIPWISVSDFQGQASPAVRSYNVKTIPANFLIDTTGNIVGTNLYGTALELMLDKTL